MLVMRRFLLLVVLPFLLCGCQVYNQYVKQRFPFSDKDEVLQLITKADVDAKDTSGKTEDKPPVDIKSRTYKVGSAITVNGHSVPQPVVLPGAIILMDRLGTIYSIDSNAPGTVVRWKATVEQGAIDDGEDAFVNHASIAYSKNKLFVSVGLDFIEAYSTSDGARLWRANIIGSARGEIIVDSERLFVLTNENRVYALNQNDGSLLWISNAFSVPFKLVSSPAASLHGNKLIVAMPNRSLVIFNKETGFLLKQISLEKVVQNYTDFLYDVTSPPVIKDQGMLLSIYNEDLRYVGYDGKVIWYLPIYTDFSPVFVGDYAFVLGHGNVLYSIRYSTGKVQWKSNLSLPYKPKFSVASVPDKFFGPVVYKDELLVFSRSGHVMRFNPSNGLLVGRFEVSKGLQGVPCVHDGALYVYTSKKATVEVLRY